MTPRLLVVVIIVFVLSFIATATERGMMCCLGCDASCPLDEFIELTKPVVPTDWHAECGIFATNTS